MTDSANTPNNKNEDYKQMLERVILAEERSRTTAQTVEKLVISSERLVESTSTLKVAIERLADDRKWFEQAITDLTADNKALRVEIDLLKHEMTKRKGWAELVSFLVKVLPILALMGTAIMYYLDSKYGNGNAKP